MGCEVREEIHLKIVLLNITRDIWYRLSEKKYYGLLNIGQDQVMLEQHKQKVVEEVLDEIEKIYRTLEKLIMKKD